MNSTNFFALESKYFISYYYVKVYDANEKYSLMSVL